ncbi:MAG TPA: VOC family protein [Pilimelia sp.]|nr:VOC family protein [Pilimelia sp.]
MDGVPAFVEIGVPDLEKGRIFYEKLFGWTSTPLPVGTLTLHLGGDNAGAAREYKIGAGMHPDPDPQIYVYFRVADLDATLARVVELGGETFPLRPGSPEAGRYAECRDNQGVIFGLHEPPSKTS